MTTRSNSSPPKWEKAPSRLVIDARKAHNINADSFKNIDFFKRAGRVQNASGPVIRATGYFSIGEVCTVVSAAGKEMMAEVIGFDGDIALLTPYGDLKGISTMSQVKPLMNEFEVKVSEDLCGRVLDAIGRPMDGKSPIQSSMAYPAMAYPPDPMSRAIIDTPFPVGVRAIDGMLTTGIGQRMGIFAAAGGGKSVLMSMLARHAQFDYCVICLIGERGREVREFIEHNLDEQTRKKAVVVIATSDRPAIEQVNAAYTATAIAEYLRDQGGQVLLIMDSVTRFARAQRQIGLSAGEPPTRRGFPPSVFERLPALLERAGKLKNGSITAFYTVLVEGDDMTEPVADEVRGLIDGHIILSRALSMEAHYPAIDVGASASRLFNLVTKPEQREAANLVRTWMARFKEVELLLRVGEYTEGTDAEADAAVKSRDAVKAFLRQKPDEYSSLDETLQRLYGLKKYG